MSTVNELKRLSRLHAEGALSARDFEAARDALLDDVQDAEVAEPLDTSAPLPETDTKGVLLGALGAAAMVSAGAWLMGAPSMVAGTAGIAALGAITWIMFKDLDPNT